MSQTWDGESPTQLCGIQVTSGGKVPTETETDKNRPNGSLSAKILDSVIKGHGQPRAVDARAEERLGRQSLSSNV